MTKREEFIYSKIKESQVLVLIMENNFNYFVQYNDSEMNFLKFVYTKEGYIIPRYITLKEFLILYSDDDILAAILKAAL